MSAFPRGRTAIVGAATFGTQGADGLSALDLAAHASILALADAGLNPSDVDGVFVCLPLDLLAGLALPEYLGISPKVTDNNRTGGSAFQTYVRWAALALDAGVCDVALIAYGSTLRSEAGRIPVIGRPDPFEGPYKPRHPTTGYALAASRHMHQYGTTREQLAEVAVAARQWANLNPEANAQGPLSIADVVNARMVCDPLGVKDCCLLTDGAAAIVMTRADRALNHAAKPAYVLGAAEATFHNRISAMPDLTVTAASLSGPRAMAQAGIRPADVDVMQLYDAFTINPILFLEDLGFCPKGEGGRFVENGRLGPGGGLAINTNGGGLSCVHPGMYGLFELVEATTQLMGRAGARQVKDPSIALTHANGGVLSSQCTVILGSADTL